MLEVGVTVERAEPESSGTTAWATDEARWEAVLGREAAADGVFYYGVRTTGVYCRPTCPARRPKREHVAFYETPEAAERAGLRPCRRCHPDEVAEWQRVVARVQELLDSGAGVPSLAALGAAVGLSPGHLQRVFKRATGLSPRQYAASRRAERLRDALRGGADVTTALYDAGYGSPRALYEAAPKGLGMTPGAYRRGGAGERVAYDVVASPLGPLLVAATARGLCAVRFGQGRAEGRAEGRADAEETPGATGATGAGGVPGPADELRAELPLATLVHDPEGVAPYTRAVLDHLAGRRRQLDLPLDVAATPFQQRVWAALREIPYGETRTYREVAQMIGQPSATRAVAQACATNPVALVVPCHRVVPAGGGPAAAGGYRWGTARKASLLRQEAAGFSGGAGAPAG
jgi:AraC family transcriptional regulator of adaptative response/methylated-DNA-[protein]-cysteine methyltransferase